MEKILMQEFAELTDRARSSLALSEYEESIHCYEKALENSASLLTSITNAVEKEKWEEIRKNIVEELEGVRLLSGDPSSSSKLWSPAPPLDLDQPLPQRPGGIRQNAPVWNIPQQLKRVFGSKKKQEQRKKFQDPGFEKKLIESLENDILTKNPDVKWNDICNLEDAKNILYETVILPPFRPDFFTDIREPSKGILLFGPPGTGKTLLAKAVATEGKSTFFNVTSATLTSKYRGESEKLIRLLFKMAKYYAPSVIFLDEIECIASQRGEESEQEASLRVKTELLVNLDGMSTDDEEDQKPVILLAATNCPWNIDMGVLRRLEKRIYIPLPDERTRSELLKMYLKKVGTTSDVNFDEIAVLLKDYSAADIKSVCRDAAMIKFRKKTREMSPEIIHNLPGEELVLPVSMEDLRISLTKVKKTVNTDILDEYSKWAAEHGSE